MTNTLPIILAIDLSEHRCHPFDEAVPDDIACGLDASTDILHVMADSAEEAVIAAIHRLSWESRQPIHSDFIHVEEAPLNPQQNVTFEAGPDAKGWNIHIGSCTFDEHPRALLAWLKYNPSRPIAFVPEGPAVGSRWRRKKPWDHTQGQYNAYTVVAVTNTHHKSDKHPPDVVYRGDNGNWWTLPLTEWPGNLVPERR